MEKDFQAYTQRGLKQFLEANSITEERCKRALFLMASGSTDISY